MNAAKLWPIAIVGVLVVTVAANAVLLFEAGDREAAAVEPDYYRKAVAWDSVLAQENRNAALGWRLQAELGAVTPSGTPLIVRLSDARGLPLADGDLAVEAIHNREATHRVRATLSPTADGVYAATLPLAHRGLWELRFTAVRAGERFTATVRRDAAEGAP